MQISVEGFDQTERFDAVIHEVTKQQTSSQLLALGMSTFEILIHAGVYNILKILASIIMP